MKRISIPCVLALCLIAAPVFAGDTDSDPIAVELMTLYRHMHTTLAADRTEGVAELAAMMAHKTEPCECGGEHKAEFEAVHAAALAIPGKDLAALRAAFAPLSRAMSALGVAAGIAGVQLYYCPMNKGYWLQTAADAEARNPYLGPTMPECGSKVDKLDS